MIERMLKPLRTRLANMVARGVVKLVDSSKRMQLLQLGVLTDETRDEVEHFEPYGMTSVPREGAEAILLSVGGRRDHAVAIVVGDRAYRIRNLESGEVALGWDGGPQIVCKANGDIEVTATGNVVLNGGAVPVAKVGSSLIAGPFGGTITSGSNTVLVP